MNAPLDPVAARRARFARAAALGKRVGYLALAVAVVTFAVGAVTGFPEGLVTVTIAALVAACVVLPAPIVIGYGVRAAEREDRERARRQGGGTPTPQQ